MAVFLPMKGHIKFVQDTLAELADQGVRIHCYTEPEHVAYYKDMMRGSIVLPYQRCQRIPYRVILTPATHIAASRYRHPSSLVVHLPHSMVSLHTIFPPSTFIGFDHVFCCGPHHVEEIRAIFRHNGQEGEAVATGYEVIDRLARLAPPQKQAGPRPCILVAPTWGESGALHRFGRAIIDRLIPNYDVILRPHPWRLEQLAPLLQELTEAYSEGGRLRLDHAIDAKPSMDAADLMISDYSGVAFEFALGYLRPVVFMDGPRKNAYLDAESILQKEGIEVRARDTIGTIVQDLDQMETAIHGMLADRDQWSGRSAKARDELLFNFGSCARQASSEILRILQA